MKTENMIWAATMILLVGYVAGYATVDPTPVETEKVNVTPPQYQGINVTKHTVYVNHSYYNRTVEIYD